MSPLMKVCAIVVPLFWSLSADSSAGACMLGLEADDETSLVQVKAGVKLGSERSQTEPFGSALVAGHAMASQTALQQRSGTQNLAVERYGAEDAALQRAAASEVHAFARVDQMKQAQNAVIWKSETHSKAKEAEGWMKVEQAEKQADLQAAADLEAVKATRAKADYKSWKKSQAWKTAAWAKAELLKKKANWNAAIGAVGAKAGGAQRAQDAQQLIGAADWEAAADLAAVTVTEDAANARSWSKSQQLENAALAKSELSKKVATWEVARNHAAEVVGVAPKSSTAVSPQVAYAPAKTAGNAVRTAGELPIQASQSLQEKRLSLAQITALEEAPESDGQSSAVKKNGGVKSPVEMASANKDAARIKFRADQAAAAADVEKAEADDRAAASLIASQKNAAQEALMKAMAEQAEADRKANEEAMKEALEMEQAAYNSTAYKEAARPENVPDILTAVGKRVGRIFQKHLQGVMPDFYIPEGEPQIGDNLNIAVR